MFSLFARDRFGKPQLIAIAFLLVFMAQCLWQMAWTPLLETEKEYIHAGRALWSGQEAAFAGSRLVALAASAGAVVGDTLDVAPDSSDTFARWGARLPFLGVAVLLGGSLWYVARRLYGNTGGYIALALYCFSPTFVWHGALVNAEIVAVWGTFGTVFAGIAGAHTLYAPLTWKQRAPRAVLLGTAMALAIAASPYSLPALPLTLMFMLYLVPGRRAAALGVFATAMAVSVSLLLVFSFFDAASVARSLSGWMVDSGALHGGTATGWIVPERPEPPLALLALACVVTYAFWRRARYFGNTAPLLAAVVLLAPGMGAPPLQMFYRMLPVLPFVFVFIAGIFADLLETRRRGLALGALVVLLVAHALWGIIA